MFTSLFLASLISVGVWHTEIDGDQTYRNFNDVCGIIHVDGKTSYASTFTQYGANRDVSSRPFSTTSAARSFIVKACRVPSHPKEHYQKPVRIVGA